MEKTIYLSMTNMYSGTYGPMLTLHGAFEHKQTAEFVGQYFKLFNDIEPHVVECVVNEENFSEFNEKSILDLIAKITKRGK